MADPASPLVETHHPATFRSRGVAAPFTTPMLAGARVRDSKRTGIELVVPNPSGGRGVYILHWPGVRALCNPTVHDTMLFRRFSALATIDTASIRDAALDVAAEGHAGQDAVIAAKAAVGADRSQRLMAHFLLLMGLTEQVNPDGRRITLADRTPDFDRRASAALHRIAPSFGGTPADLAQGLARMGDAFAPAGVARDDRTARIPRLIARLEETSAGLSLWLKADPENDINGLGQAMTVAMQSACDTGKAMLEATRTQLAEPLALLKRWCTDAPGVMALAKRCDSLLDGYERVALLWLWTKTDATRRGTLLEMAPLMPVLPREVLEWTDVRIPSEAMEPVCRITSREDAWRTGGAAFAMIERNESLRAMSL